MPMIKTPLMLLGLLLLDGCSLPLRTPAPEAAPAVEPLLPADRALRQALALDRELAALPPEALRQQRQLMAQLPDAPETRVGQALLLARSGSRKDLTQAIALLESLRQSPAPEAAPWQGLADFLIGQYRRQAAQLDDLQETVVQQAQQLRESQRRYDQLSQKLEALKAIELSIPARPATPESTPLADRSLAP